MLDFSTANPAQAAYMKDERALIHAARSDPAVFNELYRSYVARVYRYIFSHVGERQDAEDITAQVFIAVWEGLPRYQEKGTFAAWVFRIARNKTSDYYRSRRVPLSIDSLADTLKEEWDPLENLARKETHRRLAVLVENLNKDERELIRLRFAAELSYTEIATLLGRTEAAVKMAFHRMLRRLQDEWDTLDE